MVNLSVFVTIVLLACFAYSAPLTQISGPDLVKKVKASTKPVVMNFWTTWCAPCKEEFPLLLEEKKAFQGQVDFYFVSLDAKSQFGQAEGFLKSKDVDFETFFKAGSDDEFITAVLPKWAGAVPVTAFYRPKGKMVKLHEGAISRNILKTNLKLLTSTKK